jgi:hypothetical protein
VTRFQYCFLKICPSYLALLSALERGDVEEKEEEEEDEEKEEEEEEASAEHTQ